MPDRATIEAATPKCPVGSDPYAKEQPEPCGRRMEWNEKDFIWSCPEHGNCLTPQSLVHRQRGGVFEKAPA